MAFHRDRVHSKSQLDAKTVMGLAAHVSKQWQNIRACTPGGHCIKHVCIHVAVPSSGSTSAAACTNTVLSTDKRLEYYTKCSWKKSEIYYVHVLFLHVNFIIIITIIVSGLIIILMRVLRVLWALPTGGCCCAIATFGRMPKQTTSIAPRHGFVPYRVPTSFFPLELVGNMCRHGTPHQGRATAWPAQPPTSVSSLAALPVGPGTT